MLDAIIFVPPLPLVQAQMAKLALGIGTVREPLQRAVTEVVSPSIAENFDAEGRPSWDPLSEMALKERTSWGYGAGPILQRTKSLRDAATALSSWTITADSAFVAGFPGDTWYGIVHEFGAPSGSQTPGGYIPARPFMMLQPEDMDAIEGIFDSWLGTKLVEAGF